MGFAPLDEPQIAIYVLIDRPQVEDQAHSTYATEFAHDIMKETFPFLGIYNSSPNSTAAPEDSGSQDGGSEDAGSQDGGSDNGDLNDNSSDNNGSDG